MEITFSIVCMIQSEMFNQLKSRNKWENFFFVTINCDEMEENLI